MTVAQARKRYPLVPDEILKWAVQNISDQKDLEIGLFRLEQTRRLQIKYAV
jgi:hypothetical protein